MTDPYYPPPGNIQDFNDQLKEQWSQYMDNLFDQTIAYNPPDALNYGPRPGFFNPLKEGVDPHGSSQFAKIEWVAFPKTLTTSFGYTGFDEKYSHGDMRERTSRDNQGRVIGIYQDEYLEWNSTRDADGNITEIYMTCENPEYWSFFLQNDPDNAIKEYEALTGVNPVDHQILFPDGNYDPENQYNLDHCVHLCQPNNSLGAELDIAACATILRAKTPGGPIITNQDDLIKCAKFGNAGRNSDPHIGDSVNSIARQGHVKISIPNPVGLYMEYIPNETIIMPDDTDPAELFTPIRVGNYNNRQYIVRAKISVPEGKNWKLQDIILGSQKFKYAGQFVDYMNIYLFGMTKVYTDYNPEPMQCTKFVQARAFATAINEEHSVLQKFTRFE